MSDNTTTYVRLDQLAALFTAKAERHRILAASYRTTGRPEIAQVEAAKATAFDEAANDCRELGDVCRAIGDAS